MEGNIRYEHTFLIPESLDLVELTREYPIDGIPNFKEEKLLEVIDTISQIPARNHDIADDITGFIPVNASILRDRIGNRYHYYLRYLVDTGVFECYNHFSRHTHVSRKYKFSDRYDRPLKEVKMPVSAWLERKVAETNPEEDVEDGDISTAITTLPLPAHRSELNMGELRSYNSFMRRKYPYVFKWFEQGRLKIDYEAATYYNNTVCRLREAGLIELEKRWNPTRSIWLPKKPSNQQRANAYALYDLKRQAYNCHFDTNVFRMYSPLTNLNKELRAFLRWDGQQMGSVDISNSQPFLLAALLNPRFWMRDSQGENFITLHQLPYSSNYIEQYPLPNIITLCNFFEVHQPPDVELFKRIVTSGTFYEEMGQLLPTPASGRAYTRKGVKRLMFIVLFSDNAAIDQSWAKAKRDFRRIFPNVNRLIELVKANGRSNLPLLLQRLESFIMYDRILPRLNGEYPSLLALTIHDGIATVHGGQDIVARVLQEEVYKATGLTPGYKYELWDPHETLGELAELEWQYELLSSTFQQDLAVA